MPYKPDSPNLPSNVKKMDSKKQHQWIAIFNSSIEAGDDEETAFKKANGTVKTKGLISELYSIDSRQLTQENAGYNPLGMKDGKGCANCNWFVPGDDGCIVVSGDILPTGLSNLWQAKPVYTQPPLPVTIVSEAETPENLSAETSASTEKIEKIKKIEKSVVEGLVGFLKSLFPIGASLPPVQPGPSSFTFFKGGDGLRFFAIVSNNFRDKSNELIPEVVHKEYVAWADQAEIYPELWLWHTPGTKFGQIDWLECNNGVLIASGLIDKDKEYIVENLETIGGELGISHGMKCLIDKSGIISMYRTFEVSVLPRDAAAVPATDFYTIKGEDDVAFSDKKRGWLQKVAGVDEAFITQLEQDTDALVAGLKGLGHEFKDNDEVDPIHDQLRLITEGMVVMSKAITAFDAKIVAVAAQAKQDADTIVAKHWESVQATLPKGFEASTSKETELDSDEARLKKDVGWYGEVVKMAEAMGGGS